MTIQEMKEKKQERGYTYEQIASLSGVPLGTVQKIFSGETKAPRYDTMLALEHFFTEPLKVQESIAYHASASRTSGHYTVQDYYALPSEQRVELIDGFFYDMAAPTPLHQMIVGEFHRQISNFIMERGGACRAFVSPIDVQLDCDDRTMIQPDVVILCQEDKLRKWGIYGAPDFALEVVSQSSRKKDSIRKLSKYAAAGVREYWILDPDHERLVVYFFDGELCPIIYGLDEPVPIGIYDGELTIDLTLIAEWIHRGIGM
jgi:Uma2 family endonuclease